MYRCYPWSGYLTLSGKISSVREVVTQRAVSDEQTPALLRNLHASDSPGFRSCLFLYLKDGGSRFFWNEPGQVFIASHTRGANLQEDQWRY